MTNQNEEIVCVHCDEPIQLLNTGEDNLVWCENCQLLEGDTKHVEGEE